MAMPVPGTTDPPGAMVYSTPVCEPERPTTTPVPPTQYPQLPVTVNAVGSGFTVTMAEPVMLLEQLVVVFIAVTV